MLDCTTSETVDDLVEGDPGDSWRRDPDVVLMEKARDGDKQAFATLFRKHSSSVQRHSFQIVRSRERAAELAQTVFLQLYRARERYEPRAKFLTYLYRITTNVCLNELRRREYAETTESLSTPYDASDENSALQNTIADESSPDPAEHASGTELSETVKRVLDDLPLNQRAAFLLGRVDGASYQEVAETLDTSVSAVKSLVFRATATIRAELQRAMAA